MLIDLHSHTLPRSMCSSLQPAELVKRAKELGLDGICITEHDQVWPGELISQLAGQLDFLVLPGMEVSTNAGHVLVFGLEQYVQGIWDVERLRQTVDSVGGVMIFAHPLRDSFNRLPRDELCRLFDALEVLNGGDSDQHNSVVLGLSQRLSLKGTGGSDAHALYEVGTCATEFEGEIRNLKDLVEALKGNSYGPRRLR